MAIQITLPQLQAVLFSGDSPLVKSNRRKLDSVHVHHTWRPSHSQFKGERTIDAIARYHTEQLGWAATAQHLTIDPAGKLWVGRDWRRPPASARGHNGDEREGPFMIEVIGDFDEGRDVLCGAQRRSLLLVLKVLVGGIEIAPCAQRDAGVLLTYEVSRIRKIVNPHCALGSHQSCPGFAPTLTRNSEFTDEFIGEISDISLSGESHWPKLSAGYQEELVRARDLRWRSLMPHIVNTAGGVISTDGRWDSDLSESLFEGIADHISSQAKAGTPAHIMLYAHGGLNNEEASLDRALKYYKFWLRNNIYPVFFIWETGWSEVVAQEWFDRRGFLNDAADKFAEFCANGPGTYLWSLMKQSAARASQADAKNGEQGGAYRFMRRLNQVFADAEANGHLKNVRLHGVGHSAGSIFLSEMVGSGHLSQPFKSLSFLAPAINVASFGRLVQPVLGDPGKGNRVEHLNVYTMDEQRERADRLAAVYSKSLLYLVSNALDGVDNSPILGLQESIRADDALDDQKQGGLFHPDSAHASVFWSDNSGRFERRTNAKKHGDFDDDESTMNSVAHSILYADTADEGDDPGSKLAMRFPGAASGARSHDEEIKSLVAASRNLAQSHPPDPEVSAS